MNKIWSYRPLILIIITAVLLAAIACGYKNDKSQVWQADLNNNGIDENYSLYRQQVTVQEGSETIWQSPKDWQIGQILIGDVTNDGCQELVLLLWKHGSYGPSKPVWAEGEDTALSNHLFVYSLIEDHLKQVWCSSAISEPLCDLQIITDPQDGQNYLTARKNKFGPRDTVYLKWDEWGFTYEPQQTR